MSDLNLETILTMDSSQFKEELRRVERENKDILDRMKRQAKEHTEAVKKEFKDQSAAAKAAMKSQVMAAKDAAREQNRIEKEALRDWKAGKKAQEREAKEILRDQAAAEKAAMKDFIATEKAAARESIKIWKEHARMMNDALRPGSGGRGDGIHHANKSILNMDNPNPGSKMNWGLDKKYSILSGINAGAAIIEGIASGISSGIGAIQGVLSPILSTIAGDVKESFGSMFHDVKFAGSMGSSIQSMREMKYTAEISGVSFETLKSTIGFFERGVGKSLDETTKKAKNFRGTLKEMTKLGGIGHGGGDSADLADSIDGSVSGTNLAAKRLKRLGMSSNALAGSNFATGVTDLAIKVEKMGSAAERSAAYFDVLGKGAQRAMPLLHELGTNAGKAREDFRTLSAETTRFDYGKIEVAVESIKRLKIVYDSMIQQISFHLAPLVSNLIEKLIGMGLTGDNIKKAIDSAFVSIEKFAVTGISFALDFGEVWPQIFERMKNGFEVVASYVDSLMKDFGSFLVMIDPAVEKLMDLKQTNDDNIEFKRIDEERRAAVAARAEGEREYKGAYDFVKKTNPGDNFGIHVKDRQDQGLSMMSAMEKKISSLDNDKDAIFKRQAMAKDAESTLSRIGHAMENGTLFKDFPKIWADGNSLKIHDHRKEAEEFVKNIFHGGAEDRAKNKADNAIDNENKTPPDEKAKAANATAPLGFGGRIDQMGGPIGAIINSMQRGGTQVTEVHDSTGNRLLSVIAEKVNQPAKMGA